jgi:shikimate 5-dehydrogenase
MMAARSSTTILGCGGSAKAAVERLARASARRRDFFIV